MEPPDLPHPARGRLFFAPRRETTGGTNMLMIAIVDDDPRDAHALREQAQHFFAEAGEAVTMREYRDGVDFIRSSEVYDIAFLDIRMEKLDGLETARLLRKINRDALIIFVTNMAQFAIRGYEVDAMDFIIKPSDQFSVDRVLGKALKRLKNRGGTSILLKTASGTVRVSSGNIYYVEIYNHDLIYHTAEGDFKVRGQLSEARGKLEDEHFILCSRSYLVNLRYVTRIGADTLTVHGEQVPISKSHHREIERRFAGFLGENL